MTLKWPFINQSIDFEVSNDGELSETAVIWSSDQLFCYNLSQGIIKPLAYATEFWTITARSGWIEPVLLTIYRRGLSPKLYTEMACGGEALIFGTIHPALHIIR